MIFDKYIWKFAEWCLNIPLLEMASDRNNKMSRIQSKSETINEHLFKWYLMPNSIDCNHWLNEINDKFFEIQNLKWGKKKTFKSDEYFNFIYHHFYTKSDYISIDYRRLNREFSKIENKYEDEYQIDYNINSFVEGVGNLLKEVSVLLEVDEYDYDHLNSLIKKYLK
jgi:hypothetical protein